jgi:SAM-dependent methyltransferase
MMTEELAVRVAPSNTDQLGAWDGDEGAYWAAHADHFDRCMATHHRALMEAAAIAPSDRVLDLGCGTGQTTRDAARAATGGTALGVDLSSLMIQEARRRAESEGLANAFFEQADAQIHPFDAAAYDVAISRTGAMFFGDLPAAFANVARAVRSGGRIALLTWQPLSENEWIQAFMGALAAGRDLPGPPPDGPGPFTLAEPDRVRAVLGGTGFGDVTLEPLRTGMWFGDDAEDAHRFILGQLGWMLQGLDAGTRARAEESLRSTMVAHESADGVDFDSAAWLIRAVRA